MNTEFIQQRFKHYRNEIARLKEQVQDLECTLESQYYYAEEASARASRQAENYRREMAERERQAEADMWYREDKLREANRNLERALSYGDEWGIERAKRQLKDVERYF